MIHTLAYITHIEIEIHLLLGFFWVEIKSFHFHIVFIITFDGVCVDYYYCGLSGDKCAITNLSHF